MKIRSTPLRAIIANPARVIDTTYQNLTGRPVLVILDVEIDRRAGAGAGAFANLLVDSVTPPVERLAQITIQSLGYVRGCWSFLLNAGYYWRLETTVAGGGTVFLGHTQELILLEPQIGGV